MTQIWRKRGIREWVFPFISSDKEIPNPVKQEHDGRSEVMNHLTGKLFSIIGRNGSSVTISSSKKKGPITFF
jgi:hypothetical protein